MDFIYFCYDEDGNLLDIELSEDAARASVWPGCSIEAHTLTLSDPSFIIEVE